MISALYIAWLSIKYSFLLWVYFLAVMKLRDIRDAGQLVGPIKYPALAVLGVGYALDAGVNVFPVSLFVWEWPKWQRGENGKREWTVSDRTYRLKVAGGWRGRLSAWLRTHFLAKADKSGGHD